MQVNNSKFRREEPNSLFLLGTNTRGWHSHEGDPVLELGRSRLYRAVQANPGEVAGEVKKKLTYNLYGPAKLRRGNLVLTRYQQKWLLRQRHMLLMWAVASVEEK
jgi:hypothetical protein